jgi:hypothetical protein
MDATSRCFAAGDPAQRGIRARERERTSQTPYKKSLEKVLPYQKRTDKTGREKKLKKSLAMPKTTDKTAPGRIGIIGGNTL